MSKTVHLLPTQTVLIGAGAVAELGPLLQRRGLRRALLVTSRSLAETTDLPDRLTASLAPVSIVERQFARAHAPRADVEAIYDTLVASKADTIIGLGGGSVSDVIKAVLAQVLDEAARPAPYYAAIATTLSGSEFAHYFGVAEDQGSQTYKASFVRPEVTAGAVILDPAIARFTPEALWLSSGIKALDHAIEGLIGSLGTPVLETMLQRGIRRLAEHIERSRDVNDSHAREQCLIGAWECYFAPASMILGLSHRIGHMLGGTFAVPHGYTSCITLPEVTRRAAPFRPEALALAARALRTDRPLDLSAKATTHPDEAGALLAALVSRLGLPGRLKDVGVNATALSVIAAEVATHHPHVLAAVGIDGHAQDAASRLEQMMQPML